MQILTPWKAAKIMAGENLEKMQETKEEKKKAMMRLIEVSKEQGIGYSEKTINHFLANIENE